MVEYYVEAIDQQGRFQSMTLTAKNSTMADELVRAQGLQPTLITHAKSRQQDESFERHQRERRRTFSIAGILLIAAVLLAGVLGWRYIQNLGRPVGTSAENIQSIVNSPEAASRATGATDALAQWARVLYANMEARMPGVLSRVNVKNESTMFVYFTQDIESHSAHNLEVITALLTQQLHEAFGSDTVTVICVLDGQTISDGRYSYGETIVNLHRGQA